VLVTSGSGAGIELGGSFSGDNVGAERPNLAIGIIVRRESVVTGESVAWYGQTP
jgi:hypothetical protein